MTQRILAVLLLCMLLLGCGRYGPPVRVGTAVRVVAAPHAASCEDPQHDHAQAKHPDGVKP